MEFYEQGREKGDFEAGIRMALQAILCQPALPVPPRGRCRRRCAPRQTYRITDLDLASRLSFFLWGTGPTPELLTRGQQGTLRTPAGVREAGASACWPIARSEALSTRFASQWLRLQDLEQDRPGLPAPIPQYDDTLAEAMMRETELFFDSIVREDRSVLDLLTADYTFVNERARQALRHPERARAATSAA